MRYTGRVRGQIAALEPYSPGLSIDEIRQRFGLHQVFKMASNENPLGVPPLAHEAIARSANACFRYPRSGNPRLVQALSELHKVPAAALVVGNGSDEIIDLLIRMLAKPGQDNIVCCAPCFSLYPIQSQINGIDVRRCPLNTDFSFNFEGLLDLVCDTTKILFLTTPDNPSGFCPSRSQVLAFADSLARKAPQCLLVIDEAYMDFAMDEASFSLLASGTMPENTGIMRTFSKSYGLAGLRLGYAILPLAIAEAFWKARLPFSVNILAEEAGLAALRDLPFREATMKTVHQGRALLTESLRNMGAHVFDSQANFLLFTLPENTGSAEECAHYLLSRGVIIRQLKGYDLPCHLRVSVGNAEENALFLKLMAEYLRA